MKEFFTAIVTLILIVLSTTVSQAAFITTVAEGSNSTGIINFGSNGGTLTTGSLIASPMQLKGTGTIIARSLVSDIDLVFDSSHGLSQTLTLNEPGQDITISLKAGSLGSVPSDFGAGYQGNGTLVPQITVVSPPKPRLPHFRGGLPSFPSRLRGVWSSRR